MRESTISKHLGWGPGSAFAVRVGAEIRRLRRERGLTQGELGHPLTKGFVSSVERGRTVPSLGALGLMAERLSVTPGRLIDVGQSGRVHTGFPGMYSEGHDASYFADPSSADG